MTDEKKKDSILRQIVRDKYSLWALIILLLLYLAIFFQVNLQNIPKSQQNIKSLDNKQTKIMVLILIM